MGEGRVRNGWGVGEGRVRGGWGVGGGRGRVRKVSVTSVVVSCHLIIHSAITGKEVHRKQ